MKLATCDQRPIKDTQPRKYQDGYPALERGPKPRRSRPAYSAQSDAPRQTTGGYQEAEGHPHAGRTLKATRGQSRLQFAWRDCSRLLLRTSDRGDTGTQGGTLRQAGSIDSPRHKVSIVKTRVTASPQCTRGDRRTPTPFSRHMEHGDNPSHEPLGAAGRNHKAYSPSPMPTHLYNLAPMDWLPYRNKGSFSGSCRDAGNSRVQPRRMAGMGLVDGKAGDVCLRGSWDKLGNGKRKSPLGRGYRVGTRLNLEPKTEIESVTSSLPKMGAVRFNKPEDLGRNLRYAWGSSER